MAASRRHIETFSLGYPTAGKGRTCPYAASVAIWGFTSAVMILAAEGGLLSGDHDLEERGHAPGFSLD
jgi:hypothetical protein